MYFQSFKTALLSRLRLRRARVRKHRVAFAVRALPIALPIALSIGSLAISGCSVATNDGGDNQGPLKMTLPQTDCLAQAFPVVQSYFQGTSNVSEVSQAWSCASDAVTMFTANTQGANPDYYTPKEIRSFLEQFFLGDIKVSDQLLQEGMRIKQVLLGGSIDKITREELARAQTAIQILKNESLRNHPYMPILITTMTREEALKDPAKVEVAMQNLQITAINIGALFSSSSITYETKDLKNLLNAVKPLFKNWSGPDNVIKYIPTFELAKSVFLNPMGSKIAASDWQPLLANAAKLYAVYLRSEYLMKGQDLMSGEGLKQMMRTIDEVAVIVRTAIDVKPSKTISYAYLDQIVDEMIRMDLWALDVRDSTMQHTMRVAFNKLFYPKVSGKRKSKPDGLNLVGFDSLYSSVMGWLDMQRVWNEVQAQAVYDDPRLKGQAIPVRTVRKLWPKTTSQYKQAHEDLRRLFNRENPIVYAANGTVVFERSSAYQAYSKVTFQQINWKSLAMRIAISAYSDRPDKDAYSGLTKAQTKELFDDIHPMATDFKFVEPDDKTLWETSFDEANMFMLTADANDKLSYNETLDWLSLLLGGGVLQTRLYDDVSDRCGKAGQDYFGRKQVSVECFRPRHKATFSTTYKELPNWVKLVKTLDDENFLKFQEKLESATRDEDKIGKPVGISEITRMTMVMQYIESIYTRFDEDQSGTITYEEAEKAFPLFRDVLKEASGLKTDKSNFGLFCWLLYKGKAPSGAIEKADFAVIWLKSESKWRKVNANRLMLLSIVSSLKENQKE